MSRKNRGFQTFMVLALSIAIVLVTYMISAQAISLPWEDRGSVSGKQQEVQPEGQTNTEVSGQALSGTASSQDPAESSEVSPEMMEEDVQAIALTGSGRYEGQADSNFIELTLKDASGTESPRVFQLSPELKEAFDDLKLKTGDSVVFTYEEREGQNPLMHSLKKGE